MTEKNNIEKDSPVHTSYGSIVEDAKYGNDNNILIPSPNSEMEAEEDSKGFKIFKTGTMVFAWIFIGIFTAIIGATLIDLTEIAGCTYAQIGQTLTGLHLAMPVGSITGGILCGRYPGHLDLFLSIFLASLALSTAALPWCSSLWLMASVMVVEGLSRSALTCCGNVMMIQLWKEKTAAPLHAMHFGTGFGSFVAPLLVSPFISPQKNHTTFNTSGQGSVYGTYVTTVGLTGAGNTSGSGTTHIYIPYGIEGGYGVFCAIIFFLFYLRQKRKTPKQSAIKGEEKSLMESTEQSTSFKKILSPATCARGNFAFGLTMASLLFVFYCCVIGVIVSYSTYLLPVAIDGHAHLTKKEATYLTSGYWGSFAAGRFVSAFFAKFVPIHIMFATELSATLATAAVLAFLGLRSSQYLWISTCVFAFVSAPVFPSGVSWTNVYLDVTGPLMSIFQSGVGVGAFVAGIYGGYGLQEFGPQFPLYLNFGFAIALVILYILLQTRAYLHGPKDNMVKSSEPAVISQPGPNIVN